MPYEGKLLILPVSKAEFAHRLLTDYVSIGTMTYQEALRNGTYQGPLVPSGTACEFFKTAAFNRSAISP
jgi:hypothetical protein